MNILYLNIIKYIHLFNLQIHSNFSGFWNGYLSFNANEPIVITNPSQNKQKTMTTHVGMFTVSSGSLAIA